MASSLPAESWACNNMDVIVNDSNMMSNNALLMSLWEETQADQEHDEERLSSLIRALEEELDPSTSIRNHDMFMETNDSQFGSSTVDNFQASDAGYVYVGGDCSASGFGWIDMEIGSSNSHGDESMVMNNWYLQGSFDVDEIDCMASNFGGPQGTTPFEEQGHQNVWQESLQLKNACITETCM